jgi:hypothetical protein
MGKKGKTLRVRACRAVAFAEAGASVVRYFGSTKEKEVPKVLMRELT